jgi:hypothetical protein
LPGLERIIAHRIVSPYQNSSRRATSIIVKNKDDKITLLPYLKSLELFQQPDTPYPAASLAGGTTTPNHCATIETVVPCSKTDASTIKKTRSKRNEASGI